MFAELKLKTAEGRERTVGLLAHAAIPIRYRNTFHKDLMVDVARFMNSEDGLNTDNISGVTDMIPQLAYIMAMAAEKRDMSKLNEETFIDWLEDFSAESFTDASGDILSVYFGTLENKSTPKNSKARQAGK